MSEKLVSVIIPSFKMGQFIGEALESVGAQTYPHWEVIVVDDAGPDDGTREAVEAFAAKHPDHPVQYIRHEMNQGVSVARRTAFEASRGEYIAFLDADDAFLPEKLAKHAAVLQAEPDCVLVHGPVSLQGNIPPGAADPDRWFRDNYVEGSYDARNRHDYLKSNHICNSTVVCRAGSIARGDFPADMVYQYEDWLLWLLLSLRGKFYFCDLRLTRYRCHEGAFSSAIYRSESAKALAEVELLLAFAPAGQSAELGALIGRRLIDCFSLLAGKLAAASDVQEERKRMVGALLLRAAVGQKLSNWRAALGRLKRQAFERRATAA
jgi:glycosyltransferase involved in cell wall biosynthesis